MKKIFVLLFTSLIILPTFAQKDTLNFTMIKKVKTTPVKNQGRTGTCWAFATTSFVETELLRLGKRELDLSEMFTVRHKLLSMADNYIRYHGKSNFGDGGQAHDLLNVVREFGFVPETIYDGKNIGTENHNHGEMSSVLEAMLNAILKKRGKKLTPRWKDAVESVLNVYLGTPPQKFNYEGTEYTPKSFSESLGFNPDDYVEITSYSYHPFYTKFNLPLPDNWTYSEYYNVPMNDLKSIIDNALTNGYSVCWDGDVSKDNFYRNVGYAKIPDENNPKEEKKITQEMRQIAFDNFDVTDDHLMHIVGLAKDDDGNKYYYTKNSWGTKNKIYDGYWYMSEPYIYLKTIAILVHKNAIPKNIRQKLEIY